MNNNADVLLFTHKVRAEALQTLRIASENSPSRNSPRGLSAKRFDMVVNMDTSGPVGNRKTFEEILDENGYLVYTNVGRSMMPLIRQHRDLIEIRKKGPERCKKYDVVLYKRGSKYILHRILEVLPEGRYVIAGDNNTFLEKDITDENIIGVMTKVVRDGKPVEMDDKMYQAYVHMWCDFYPVRAGILKVKRKTRSGLSKIKRAVTGGGKKTE